LDAQRKLCNERHQALRQILAQRPLHSRLSLRVRLKTRQKGQSRANLWNDQIPTSLPD
jgi:hypothetical protein